MVNNNNANNNSNNNNDNNNNNNKCNRLRNILSNFVLLPIHFLQQNASSSLQGNCTDPDFIPVWPVYSLDFYHDQEIGRNSTPTNGKDANEPKK